MLYPWYIVSLFSFFLNITVFLKLHSSGWHSMEVPFTFKSLAVFLERELEGFFLLLQKMSRTLWCAENLHPME